MPHATKSKLPYWELARIENEEQEHLPTVGKMLMKLTISDRKQDKPNTGPRALFILVSIKNPIAVK